MDATLYEISMISTENTQLDFRFTSQKLGRDIVITDRDLRIFGHLYRYIRLDLQQLYFLEQVSASNQKRFRERLLVLSRAMCIHTFTAELGNPPIFALQDKGINIYLRAKHQEEGRELDDFKPRRITRPRHTNAEKIRRHDIGIADLALIQAQSAEARPTGLFIQHRDIFQTAIDSLVRARQGWPVEVSWKGEENCFRLKPDYLAGTGFSDRPEGHNVRFFAYEIDCSSEDMKPNTPLARGQSILRKLLSYEITIKQDLLSSYLGIDHITPLFVFESKKRRDNAVALAQEVLSSGKAKGQILFGLRLPRICEGQNANFGAIQWINGHGKKTRVRL